MRAAASLVAMFIAAVAVTVAAIPQAEAQLNIKPKEFDGVEVVEHIGEKLPLDLELVDEHGKTVTLGSYFEQGDKPVILIPGYYECPMLCGLVLNGALEGMKGLEWTPGKDFTVLNFTINHREEHTLAAAKKETYIEALGRPEAAEGWHFLTGKQANLKRLAEDVGFGYKWDPSQKQYAHGAAILLATPDGTIARYLYGIQFPSDQLRMALVESGDGELGSTIEQFLLTCFHYNPDSKKYGIYVWGVMRLGGLLTIAILGSLIFVLRRREKRARRAQSQGDFTQGDEGSESMSKEATGV